MIVIFLDIDGVLRPFGHQDENNRVFPKGTLAALAHVLAQVPESQLVLSSTWRVQTSFINVIVKDFRAYGGVLKDTDFYDITDPNLHSERQHEIYEWLKRHARDVQAWIALDDEELLEGEPNSAHRHVFEYHVIKTDSHVGMTMEDARRAVTVLQNQLEQK
eukprot:scaffold2290_cov170-Amphora_coffeaeformis.AAC.2